MPYDLPKDDSGAWGLRPEEWLTSHPTGGEAAVKPPLTKRFGESTFIGFVGVCFESSFLLDFPIVFS